MTSVVIRMGGEGMLQEPPFPRCPITGRRYFMDIDHPERGVVPTFGGPFDSYTIPETDEDGCLRCERYDHDAGDWVEGGETLAVYLTTQQPDEEYLPAFAARAPVIELCPNCDASLPNGCNGANRDDGDACLLNRGAVKTAVRP